MKDYNTNFQSVKTILVENLQINEADITPDAELVNDLGVNSLELADLIMICEENFGIEISDTAISSFITIDDFVKYLTEEV